jgi:chorismate synthase
VEKNAVRFPDAEKAKVIEEKIAQAKLAGDSLGGIVSCVVRGVPPGLGEPVFDKLHADLGKAMLSINAVKGFEIGSGFESTRMLGSQHNDAFAMQGEHVRTLSNHSGGIQGGISNGEDIYFRVAFKPVSTLRLAQQTVNTHGENTTLQVEGRHDPCVLPRAVPIVEAMAWLVLADHALRAKTNQL